MTKEATWQTGKAQVTMHMKTKFNFQLLKIWIFYSLCKEKFFLTKPFETHATRLHPALLIRLSITLLFLHFAVFSLSAPDSIIEWPHLWPMLTHTRLSSYVSNHVLYIYPLISHWICPFKWFFIEQGWIHGYPSRVWVGKGCNWSPQII